MGFSGVPKQGMAVGSLLLFCVVTSRMWDAETKPIDFVCTKAAREALNIVSEMESQLLDCEGLVTLPTTVQLPCTALHVATWELKSHQQKRADIMASLRLLIEGVKTVSALSQSSACATSLLQRLQHNINNYLLVLTHLQLTGSVESPVLSCVPKSTHSLSTVLVSYNRLVTGKVEHFMDNLSDRCPPQ